MPKVVADIIDVYVFRRLNARVQFLLLQRRPDVAMPHTWQAFHSLLGPNESTLEAVHRTVKELAGLNVSAVYSADYVNQFYDESRDLLVLAPVFAVNVSPQAPIELADDFRDCAWFDRDEATVRLPFSGQRWATRHIDEIMSLGEAEAELYRLEFPPPAPVIAPADAGALITPNQEPEEATTQPTGALALDEVDATGDPEGDVAAPSEGGEVEEQASPEGKPEGNRAV